MKLLALDTSSDACTVAVQHGTGIAARHHEGAKEHTRLLMPMIHDVMEEAALEYADLDAMVLGNGPGSFIGMRISSAVTQGIAFAAVVPVSSMAVLAAQVMEEASTPYVAIAQDAHMQEVYFGLYRRTRDGFPEPVGEERLAGQERITELDKLDPASCTAAGRGWSLYPALLDANESRIAATSFLVVPDACYVLKLGAAAFAGGSSIDPKDVNPAYLRQKVASTAAGKNP